MSLPPTDTQQNQNDGASEDEIFLERCKAYIRNPYDVPVPNNLLPSDVILLMFDDVPSSQHDMMLQNALYHRVHALEPNYSGKITAMILDLESPRHQLLGLLDNDPVLRTWVRDCRTEYLEYLRKTHREGTALMEEIPMTPFAMPSRPPRSHQGASTQIRPSQTQNQNAVGNQTHRSPQQNVIGIQNCRRLVGGQARTGTSVNVAGQPQSSQVSSQTESHLQPQPQPQPRQNAVVDANNAVPRPAAADMGRTLRLEFRYQNGWLICRELETGRQVQFDLSVVMMIFEAVAHCVLLIRRQRPLSAFLLQCFIVVLAYLVRAMRRG